MTLSELNLVLMVDYAMQTVTILKYDREVDDTFFKTYRNSLKRPNVTNSLS